MSRKTVLKALRYVFGGILFLALGGAAVVYGVSSYKFGRKHDVRPREIPIPSTAAAIERGRHIVTTRGCMDCHGKDLGGAKVIDDPMVARFSGSNLTRGVGGVPAEFGDVDFLRAIRHGVGRDGRPLILMPSYEYSMMSDEDVAAVIAYVKSVPPVDRPRGPVAPGPIGRLLTVLGEFKLSAEEIDHGATQIASITPAISPEYGKYLAASCIGCHGPNLSGGKIPGGPPDWPLAANLTPHSSGRLGQWSEAEFLNVLRTQLRPDGTKLDPVMPAAFGQMTDVELKAIWAYLKVLPPAEKGVR